MSHRVRATDCSLVRPPVLGSDRVLPVRLKPYASWETRQHVHTLPDAIRENAFTLAKVRLSTGAIIESIEKIGVPARGFVPGGPISSVGNP